MVNATTCASNKTCDAVFNKTSLWHTLLSETTSDFCVISLTTILIVNETVTTRGGGFSILVFLTSLSSVTKLHHINFLGLSTLTSSLHQLDKGNELWVLYNLTQQGPMSLRFKVKFYNTLSPPPKILWMFSFS